MNQQHLFDAEFAQAIADQKQAAHRHELAMRSRAIHRKASRIAIRRAKSEAELDRLLQWPIEPGSSVHILSSGDIESLSYLIYIAARMPIETLLISTWCMAMPDIDWLRQQIANGRIGTIDFILGEIFPSQYPDEYLAVAAMQRDGLASFKIARNHAKVMCMVSPHADVHLIVESSANLNSNPRIEQTAIHSSRELHAHYTDFFSSITSVDRATRASASTAR